MDKNTTMENLARAAYEKGGFNGAWLYAEKSKIVSSGAFGWVDAENSLPMREDSIFEMASVTKMFTATAIMLLVAKVSWGSTTHTRSIFRITPMRALRSGIF